MLWNRSSLFSFSGKFVDTNIYIRKQSIAANISNRFKAKFAALDLSVDISNSIRKQPIATNFGNRFLGEICCDWLISGYLSQETTNSSKFRQPILGRNLL